MTLMEKPDAHGVLTAPDTLEIRRVLPAPPERVWAWLTDSELRSKWLAAGEMTLVPGAEFEFVWRNNELAGASRSRPANASDEERMTGRVLALDPPRSLSITWDTDGKVTFTLAPRGEGTLLTIVHTGLGERGALLDVSAGWHTHLDILLARETGGTPTPFWDTWARLKEDYGRRLP